MVELFDARTGERVGHINEPIGPYREASVPLVALAALPDGRLAGGTARGAIMLWDTRAGSSCAARRLPSQELCQDNPRSNHNITALLPLPDGRLVSAMVNGLPTYGIAGGKPTATLKVLYAGPGLLRR